MPPRKEYKTDTLALVFLLIIWALFYFRVLFQGQTFILEDSSRFFFPLWKWGAAVWGKGWVPLWNPDAGFGTPYLADPQTAAWYPPLFLLYRFFQPVTAFNLLITGHHLWALFGFYLFARRRGFSPWIALAGSLTFGFTFNAISLSWATPMLLAFSWSPWVFTAAQGLEKGQRGSFFPLSIALAFQLAAGYPLFFYLTLMVLFIDWVLRTIGNRSLGFRKPGVEIGLGLGAALLALAFNAAWLLPFKEFAPLSNLGLRAGFSEALHWDDLATWFNPFFKGHPLHSHPETPYSVTVYFAGLPVLAAFFWGLWRGKFSKNSFCLFFVLLVLSLGETVYVGGWLKTFWPGYQLVVRSGYWIPFVVWALARLFLEAMQSFSETEGKSMAQWSITTTAVFLSGIALGVPLDLWTFWLAFLFTLLSGLGTFFGLKTRQAFLILALLFSLGPVDQSINFTLGRSYYEQPPEILAQLNQPGRIYHTPSAVDGLATVSGNGVADVYGKLKESVAPNWPLVFGLEEAAYSNTIFLKSLLPWYYAPEGETGSRGILNYLRCRYVMGQLTSLKEVGAGEKTAGGLPLWENPSCGAGWYSVRNAGPEGDWAGDLVKMKVPGFDFSKDALASDPQLEGTYQARQVSQKSFSPNQKTIEALGGGRALLVSSDTDYPGWRVQINGAWKKVAEVNHGFQGIVLENGEEKASLTYWPTTFRLGCFLSLLVCGFWAALFFNAIVKRKS